MISNKRKENEAMDIDDPNFSHKKKSAKDRAERLAKRSGRKKPKMEVEECNTPIPGSVNPVVVPRKPL